MKDPDEQFPAFSGFEDMSNEEVGTPEFSRRGFLRASLAAAAVSLPAFKSWGARTAARELRRDSDWLFGGKMVPYRILTRNRRNPPLCHGLKAVNLGQPVEALSECDR